MSPYNIWALFFLISLVNCVLPLVEGKQKKNFYRRINRSPAESSQQSVSKVTGTSTNITSTGNKDQQHVHSLTSIAESQDPQLKSVNTDLAGAETYDNRGMKSSLNVPNRNFYPVQNEKGQTSEGKLLDTKVFKSLLSDLLTRLDAYESKQKQRFHIPAGQNNRLNQLNPFPKMEEHRHINAQNIRHCTLHGLWLSTVAGAAIELIPEQQQGHIEIHTRIFELPDNPYPPLINSQWTGKGIISQESPTTLTIVFQEHIDTGKENHAKERGLEDGDNKYDSPVDIQLPRTAVFVGQCLVCQGNPTLQGAWVVFPASQTCSAGAGFVHGLNDGNVNQQNYESIRMTAQDSIYLLQYF